MSVFDEHRRELEHYETMMGRERGRLAVTLDLLTNSLVLLGQHGIYCRRSDSSPQPMRDIQMASHELTKAKELVQCVMQDLQKAGSQPGLR